MLYARESVSAPRGVDAVAHSKVTGCAVHCTLTDPVMTLFSSSVGRAHCFDVIHVICAQWVNVKIFLL